MFGPGVTAATAHNAANAITDVIAHTPQNQEIQMCPGRTASSSLLDKRASQA